LLKVLKMLVDRERIEVEPRPRLHFPRNLFTEIFSIGDVHGCAKELADIEQKIQQLPDLKDGRKLIVMHGDYVDRGPDSAQVLDHLLNAPPSGFERICLRGNHDDEFLKFLLSPRLRPDWLNFGGDATLRSYGVDVFRQLKLDASGKSLLASARGRVPVEHIEFLKSAPVSLSVGRLIFVHAGLRPGLALEAQSDADLMWIREPFLTEGPGRDVIVIHGHTPTENIAFGNRRIGIDTGAYLTGRLQCLRLNRDGYSVL
jgi:serine/threonine protein phosphatase 1